MSADHSAARRRRRRPRPSAERPLGRAAGDAARAAAVEDASSSARSSSASGCSARIRPALGCRRIPTRPAWTCSSRRPASTGSAPTGSAATCFARVIVGARDILIVAPLATVLGHRAGHRARAGDGLLPRAGRRRPEPDRRGVPGPAGDHRRPARARRARPVDDHGDHRHRPPLHADHRPHGALRGARRSASWTTVRPPGCAASGRRTSCSSRSCRTSCSRSSSSSPCASATRSSRSPRCRSSASASSRRRPTGACRSSEEYT